MAETGLPAARVVPAGRRRAFFGLFDADGWPWAIVKALVWFVLIITLLGYIPDRAYYFTVQQTVDLWPAAPYLKWSPVNFCPPANETLPCPAPAGATLPWHPAPAEIQLPAGRTDGAAAVIGTTYLYAGGSDGKAAAANTYVSHAVGLGNLDKWSEGPALPEARSDAASVVSGNTLYVFGGYGPDGAPTTTAYSITVGTDGTLGQWKAEPVLALPEPRAGGSAVAVSDGIVVMGGTDGKAPTRSVWKSQQTAAGAPQAWVAQQPLYEENVDGVAIHVGEVILVIGGRNLSGNPVATVQQGLVGGGPNATAKNPNVIDAWRASAQTNLPVARTNMSGFTSNGALYVQGGSDASGPMPQTWWATPDAKGTIAQWNHLPELDLGQGIEGSGAVTAGAHAFLEGGKTASGPTPGIARAYLAPMGPFFQLGILGATVPALKLDGEIGQQIGYLAAATVGAINFIGLLLVGWAFAHPARVHEIVAKRRRRNRKD
ncbi:MAG TPA: hypothetical protein VIK13_01065 [Candidatus Limnocylindrales bacterium]